MKNKFIKQIVVALLLSTIVSCSSGPDLSGVWITSQSGDVLTIKKSDTYLIDFYKYGEGHMNYSGKYENGKINVGGGVMGDPTYSKENDKIYFGGEEFSRTPTVDNSQNSKDQKTESVKVGTQVKIGTQEWSTENLNVNTFRNGDPIPEAESEDQWKKANDERKPAWCYYNGDASNGSKWGKLYNWYAVNDSRGLAPQGWHIPSHDEWTTLLDALDLIIKKKASEQEINENSDCTGGLSVLPVGIRGIDDRFTLPMNEEGYFWSSSKRDSTSAWEHDIKRNGLGRGNGGYGMGAGLSCRCVKD